MLKTNLMLKTNKINVPESLTYTWNRFLHTLRIQKLSEKLPKAPSHPNTS